MLSLSHLCVCVCVVSQRPLAMQCLRQMQQPSFPCLRYVLSCGSHSQLFLSLLQGHNAVFWSGDKDTRFVVSCLVCVCVCVQKLQCCQCGERQNGGEEDAVSRQSDQLPDEDGQHSLDGHRGASQPA